MSDQEQKLSVVRKMYTFASVVGPKEVWDRLTATKGENMKIVFYNPNDKYPVKGFRTIVRRQNRKTRGFFYGILATKFGSTVPKDATHIAVAVFGQSKIEKLYEMEIPRPYSKTIIALGKDSQNVMAVRRSARNVFITIGEANYRYPNVKKRFNEKKESVSEELKPGVIIINRKGS